MKKVLIAMVTITLATLMFCSVASFASDVAEEEMVGGGPILYSKPVKAVLFSHRTHVNDMGFDCDSCHDGIFEMASLAAQEKADFTMEGLYAGKYCGACHNGEMGFASDTQCARCHIGVKGYNKIMGEPEKEESHH